MTQTLDFRRTLLVAQRTAVAEEAASELAGRSRLVGVVWERRSPRATLRLWWRRLRRHGLPATASRLVALLVDHALTRTPRQIPPPALDVPTAEVTDVNAGAVRDLVTDLQPSLVLVAGTGLLDAATLMACGDANVINIHVGLTPLYRGSHGGAWAVIEGRPELVGTTIHRIDAGIDTGQPIAHIPVAPRATLTELAREQMRAGFAWVVAAADGGATSHVRDLPHGPLRYPPTWKEWRRFRAATAAT